MRCRAKYSGADLAEGGITILAVMTASDGAAAPGIAEARRPSSDLHFRASARAIDALGGMRPAIVAALALNANAPVEASPRVSAFSSQDSGLSWKYCPIGTASGPMSPSRGPRFPLSPP